MLWLLYLALPIYAGAQAATRVSPKYGFLAGCAALIATMVAVLIPQTALLFWLGGILERRNKATLAQPGSPSAAKNPNIKLPDQVGARARFRQLMIHDDKTERQDATRLTYRRLAELIAKHVTVEEGHEGSDAAMVSTEELVAGLDTPTPCSDDVLVVFRSHDNAWSGFRCGSNSFRFRRGAVTRIEFTVLRPAKAGGGYDITFRFNASSRDLMPDIGVRPDIQNTHGHVDILGLPFDYSERNSHTLMSALTEIAHMLDAKFEMHEYMND